MLELGFNPTCVRIPEVTGRVVEIRRIGSMPYGEGVS